MAAMRVLMLGWDFSPRLSGGVGSACQGAGRAPWRARTSRTEVAVRPAAPARATRQPEEGAPGVRGGRRAPPPPARSSRSAGRAGARGESRSARGGGARPAGPRRRSPREHSSAAVALPSVAEALRLLTIDSPLRPYLSRRATTRTSCASCLCAHPRGGGAERASAATEAGVPRGQALHAQERPDRGSWGRPDPRPQPPRPRRLRPCPTVSPCTAEVEALRARARWRLAQHEDAST